MIEKHKHPSSYGEVVDEIAQIVEILTIHDVARLRRLGFLLKVLSAEEFQREVCRAFATLYPTERWFDPRPYSHVVRTGLDALRELEAWS